MGRDLKMGEKVYVLLVERGTQPELGPYAIVAEFETAFLRAHAGSDPETDAVLVATVGPDGDLEVDSVSRAFRRGSRDISQTGRTVASVATSPGGTRGSPTSSTLAR